MQIHGRAKLGPAGRLALYEAIESGMTFRQAAACLNVSPATAHRWWRRYEVASLAKRHSLSWAADRSSRPHRSPRLLDQAAQERICEARRRTGWGPCLIAGETGSRTQRSGRCCIVMVSHAGRQPLEMLSTDTSGRAGVICCTWTQPATPASSGPGIASPAIARSAAATEWLTGPELVTTSRTRSSMTIRAWPTSSRTATSEHRPSQTSSPEPLRGSRQKASLPSG
jgi:hypothetical protein